MNTKYRIIVTCWQYKGTKPLAASLTDTYDNLDDAFGALRGAVDISLDTLNNLSSDTPREKIAVTDSDGEVVEYDYPFRADYESENYDCIIRFWDGDDYQNVTGYKICPIEEYDGYYVYRDFEIYPNTKGNRFLISSYNDVIKQWKYKFETALFWIDEWYLNA